VRQLRESQPVPFVRMEVEPGQESQVDFGRGACVMVEGKRRHCMAPILSPKTALKINNLRNSISK